MNRIAVALVLLVALAGLAAPVSAQAEPYHSYTTLKEDVQALVAEHADIARYRVVGESSLGLEIFTVDVALDIGNRSDGELAFLPTMYVDGGHHGNEILGIEAAYYFLEDVLELAADDPATLDGKRLTVTPVVNPDGFVRDTRGNARNVDLNRNYPFHWGLYGTADHPASFNYRGEAPASEPETQANIALMESMPGMRIYLSGHTGTYDLVLPWRASEDGEIPDWPMYEAYLSRVEEATGLEYRDPSGAGESIAWGYGNRTALSLVVEVSEEQGAPATSGQVEARLEEPLKLYHLAWGNLTRLQGHLEVADASGDSVTLVNSGWGPAYEVPTANGTTTLAPGATVTVPPAENLTYRRVSIVGDDPVLGQATLSLASFGDGDGEGVGSTGEGLGVPALPALATVLTLGAAAIARRRR